MRRSNGNARPRVLLVDDHRGVLNHVSSVLAETFDVAGVATDGSQALEMIRDVAPDAVVLDINMPVLDGFETMRALKKAGSQVPVVFLSMLEDKELVGEAFRCGGRGYVVKAHATRDLVSALDQVLDGRLFVPSLTSLFELTDAGGHAVLLHGETASFVDGVAAFVDMALRHGDATCVIGAEDVRDGITRQLRAAGWDIGGSGHNRCLVIDNAEALSRFMRNGIPDPGLLAEIVAELDQYRRASSEGPKSRLTIFGNLAGSLAAAGNIEAALEVEKVWNSLTHDLPFLTVCGYASSCFKADTPDQWAKTCAEHWAVGHTTDH